MSKSIYIINPASDFPTYFGGEVFAARGLRPVTHVADGSAPTVASMVPDDFHIELCDEHLTPIDFDSPADYIAITGKVSQWARMQTVAQEFRARGKTVLIGGPHASLSPDLVGVHADILVRGEIEEIAPQLFADLLEGNFKSEYQGTRPDLDLSPIPRWDLYPNNRAEWGSLQTSRGCPFKCEFCDVIPYLGNNQRHKSIGKVLAELDVLYGFGYRRIFLADDNLPVYRQRAKELLTAIGEWNDRQTDGRVFFSTQVSIDTAKDDEMLQVCSRAGLGSVFIGIETPNEDSLRESGKRQNVGVDLVAQVKKFHDYGILVTGGMIVGFDGDGPDIFGRQLEFASQAALPIVTLGALVAPNATPLHDRMTKAGRLIENGDETAGTPWHTNIVPKLMTREALFDGVRQLSLDLYAPAMFAERMERFIDNYGGRLDAAQVVEQGYGAPTELDADLQQLVGLVAKSGAEAASMVQRVTAAMARRPETRPIVVACLRIYAQIRHMYEYAEFTKRCA